MVKYIFFRIFTFYIVFDVVWVRVYKYTKINSREITSLPERKSVAADQITSDCRNYWEGGGGGGLEGLPMPRHCVIMIFCRTTVSARLETITRTHWLKDERVHNINKIKGLYEPTLESIEGFVLICSKSNILQDVCVGGGGGGGRSSVS